jgi:acylphosphatase
VGYIGRVSPEAPAEDTRVWIGRVAAGHEAEHARFLEWLNGPEAEDVFRRRRLTEYVLAEEDGTVQVVFKAPHTGDPRIMIDFLRYPGLWPDYWEFVRGGRAEEAPPQAMPEQSVKVHWRRDATAGHA